MANHTTSIKNVNDSEEASSIDKDDLQLKLHRTWHLIESFGAGFMSSNVIASVRAVFFLGLLAGGPAAMWSMFVVAVVFMFMNAAVLAELCSALPVSGSIYIWAAQSAGPKYARFFGFIVAWWSCTAWMIFTANVSQTAANYVVSQMAVWEVDFPGGVGNDNIKWRALIWAISEGFFIVSLAIIYYLPPKMYSGIFKFGVAITLLDLALCIVWLPIGVSKTYGFRSAHDVFTMTYNGTGASKGWNWMLSLFNTTIVIIVTSRLVFAVARDGVLPLSGWIGRVTPDGQPKKRNPHMILCTILASQVAFTSLGAAGSVLLVAAYTLIALLRFTMTPNNFQSSYFRLGRLAKPLYLCVVLYNGMVLAILFSPLFYPVTTSNFNFACVIFGAITMFDIISWYFTPDDKWLSRQQVLQASHTADQPETTRE
ncbi:hypothetical protein PILCRDRAFT_95587 [Piloderma croceum F 1598]|uniref:Amino acid permease/ SLC12A domain-containing protein n=1 Tax=Piloderma croceum (strain F 1598) TaxID=765440 RepID=A0A0C3G9C8_PILCF|nr:hypothetical protein PILCRDRAFT_95587 [Piloderma croceum F 1598]